MPPQQGDRLLDFVDNGLDFSAHGLFLIARFVIARFVIARWQMREAGPAAGATQS